MLFFPDDMRDYFCDSTVRKCEKLSVCAVHAPYPRATTRCSR